MRIVRSLTRPLLTLCGILYDETAVHNTDTYPSTKRIYKVYCFPTDAAAATGGGVTVATVHLMRRTSMCYARNNPAPFYIAN